MQKQSPTILEDSKYLKNRVEKFRKKMKSITNENFNIAFVGNGSFFGTLNWVNLCFEGGKFSDYNKVNDIKSPMKFMTQFAV